MYDLLNFKVHGDHTGSLVALEKGADFPFDIKRVYYIWGTDKNAIRGKHAHRKFAEKFMLPGTRLRLRLFEIIPVLKLKWK